MTHTKFHDFPGLENELVKFHDFPGFPLPVRTLQYCTHGNEGKVQKHILIYFLLTDRYM